MTTFPQVNRLTWVASKGGDTCPVCFRFIVLGSSVGRVRVTQSPEEVVDIDLHTFCAIPYILTFTKGEKIVNVQHYLKMIEEGNVRKFEDTEAANPDWDYTHVDLLDKPVVIFSITPTTTQYGEAMIGVTVIGEDVFNVLYGGVVLVKQLEKMSRDFPVSVTVVKVGTYYEFK